MDRLPGSEFLPALYDSTRQYIESRSIAAEYDDFNARNELFEYDTSFIERFATAPGALIDLGCGTGRHVLHFARRGFDVTGVDLSESMLSIASQKCAASGVQARFIRRDLRDLSDLSDNGYRYAICMFSTLGMVPGREMRQGIVKQVRRILEPGGLFFLHAHNRFHCWYSPDRLAWLALNAVSSVLRRDEPGDLHMDVYRGIPNMFLHVFSEGEMRNILENAGLEVIYMSHVNERRNGELNGAWFRSLRANGFLAVGRKN